MSRVLERSYELLVEFTDTSVIAQDPSTKRVNHIIRNGEVFTPFNNITPIVFTGDIEDSVVGKQTLLIKDLDMTSNITFSKKKGKTVNKIEILNLSKESRDLIAVKNNRVLLRGGYTRDGSLPVLFVGQVVHAETRRHGQDIITSLIVDDGYAIRDSVRVSKSYPKGVRFDAIMDDLVTALTDAGYSRGTIVYNIPTAKSITAPQGTIARTGYSITGYAEDLLKELAQDLFGLDFYIYNNKINITPFSDQKFATVRVLNIDENQIQSMTKATTGSGATANYKETDKFTLTMFLNGEVDVTDRVRIRSGAHKGEYKINSISHNMAYLGKDWDTTLELEVAND